MLELLVEQGKGLPSSLEVLVAVAETEYTGLG